MTADEKETTTAPGSFLIADCGSVNTTVALFDTVNGSFRLIARATALTTAAAPWSDIIRGIHQACKEITNTTGRPLLNEQGSLIRPAKENGAGVDHFAAVVSAAPPLSTLLVGLFDDVSLASARRALHTVYAHEVDTFSLGDGRSEEEQLSTVIQKQPDLIFMVGGTDGGADRRLVKLMHTIDLAVDVLSPHKRAYVLYAGNIHLRERAQQILGNGAGLQVVDNVRPTLESEQLDDAARTISEMYEDLKIHALPGIQEVLEWSGARLMPTARAFAAVTHYFSALHKSRVMGLDLGAESITLALADVDKTNVMVNSHLGMGRAVVNLLERRKPADIAIWMPSEVSNSEIRDFVYNRSLYPQSIPMTEEELHLEQAVVRELLRAAVAEMATTWEWPEGSQLAPASLFLLGGSTFAGTPRPGQVMLMLLDALQPTGIFSVALDRYGVLPALGALATHEPLTVVQILEAGILSDLGWVVVPVGKGQAGQKVLNVVIETEDNQRLSADVEYGTLEVLPLGAGPASVTLKPARRFDIGLGPGKGTKVTLHGGSVGLVVDARGRPLQFPQDNIAKRSLMRQWLWDMGG